jgi:P pilus assembly chaperone PapD
MLSGRPAMAAIATAIIAPEIRPPGSDAHRNSPPPAAPMATVSNVLERVDWPKKIDGDAEADFLITPPLSQIFARATSALRHGCNAR